MPSVAASQAGSRRENDPDQLARIFAKLSKLPAFHPSVLQLLNISIESDSSMQAFSDAFRSDPALAADLLMAANSVEFGSRRQIETIPHALSFLGLYRVRSLASTVALRMVMRASEVKKEDVRPVWAHGIAAAIVAEELGAIRNAPGLYAAALTHDLGRLGLLLTGASAYVEALSKTFENIEDSNNAERTLFGINHCQAGAKLGQTWGLSVGLQAGMAGHHQNAPMSAPRRIVQIACLAADFLGYPEVQRRDLELSAEVWKQTGLSEGHIREKIAQRTALLDG